MGPMQAPFVANDRGDVYVYDGVELMYSDIEAIDASGMEFFDATGRPMRAAVDGYTWRIDDDRIDRPEPDRLSSIFRDYFERLPDELKAFSSRAVAATSLEELIHLRRELAAAPAAGRLGKLFRGRTSGGGSGG